MARKFKKRSNDSNAATAVSSSNAGRDVYIREDIPFYVKRDGLNSFRILPRTWDHEPHHWGYLGWLHYGMGPDNTHFLCREKHGEGPCPICEYYREAKRNASSDEEAKRIYAEYAPKKRIFAYVIDRKEESKGPMIMDMPVGQVHDAIVAVATDDESHKVIEISDHEEGYDVSFSKTGEGVSTKYVGVKLSPKGATHLHADEDLEDQWLDFIEENPLPSVLKFYDYDYIQQISFGVKAQVDPDEVGDEDEEPAPKTRRGRKAAAQAAAAEESEEESPPWDGETDDSLDDIDGEAEAVEEESEEEPVEDVKAEADEAVKTTRRRRRRATAK